MAGMKDSKVLINKYIKVIVAINKDSEAAII
jgi:hypothetical protein